MQDVPSDIITDIFSCLPVKSLLRFRCVSKSFRALIDSPYFIKYHLNQSLLSNSDKEIISECYRHDKIYSTDFIHPKQHTTLLSDELAKIIIGSCNGLLCFLSGEKIYLFNPSTRELKLLPVITAYVCVVYGFGYDRVDDDYKVVRVRQRIDNKAERELMIYSLKLNSWRRIEDFDQSIFCNVSDESVFVNGALHWLVVSRSEGEDYGGNVDAQIMSLNLATEEYGLIGLPESDCLMKPGELGGKLSLYCSNDNMSCNLDIWVMNCYGVRESWIKLHISVWIPKLDFAQVNVYMDDEQVLFMQGRQLGWYNPKWRVLSALRILAFPECSRSYLCLRSLVKLSDAARTDVLMN